MRTVILLFVLLLPCFAMAQGNKQTQKDSLRSRISLTEGAEKLETYRLLTEIYSIESVRDDQKMDTLLALYREYDAEALRQENYKAQGLIMNNTAVAYLNRNESDKFLNLMPDYLAYLAKHEVWRHYYSIYMKGLQVYLRTGQYAKAIEGAQQMYDEAKLRDHDDGKGMSLYVLSSAYSSMSRFEEEEKYMRESIELIKNIDNLLWLTAQAYSRLCGVLVILERYDEAWQEVRAFEQIIYRFEEISKSKQPASWVNLWVVCMRLHLKNSDYDHAEVYCDKLDSIGGSPFVRYRVYSTRAQIYNARKQYGPALEMVDKALELSGGNPVNLNENLGLKLMILCAQKGVNDIYGLFQQAANLRDSIRNTDFSAQLDELRTVYEVDKHIVEKERHRNYFLFALGGCFLLSITLGVWIYYNRTIIRKNKALYRQIKEHDRLAEELKQITTDDNTESLPGDRQQRQLVARFSDYLLSERNYAQPDISLDQLISKLATNRTYLFEAVKTVTQKTPVEYIRSLQLEEAKQMLETRFELNIETIAEGCGFNSRSTFYRLFREYYQISPTEYRKIAQKQKVN